MSGSNNALGAFLRARRELVAPEQVGIREAGIRRVPGLRREEVALLAGISADYYIRLERGRDGHPSTQVLESLARVLQLDDDHLSHLLNLVADTPQRRAPSDERPPAGALKLLDSLTQPAFIEGRYFDILASNKMARAICPNLTVGGNQLRDFLLNPDVQARHPDWEDVTELFVANLRQAAGSDIDDPRFVELVSELSIASPYFRRLFKRHEVRGLSGMRLRIEHPRVGALTLNRERMAICGGDRMMLVVYHADAGSSDAEKLALLASAGVSLHTLSALPRSRVDEIA